ncbi:DUF4838 domain-containing protein, partial [bacterium]|nr:DUF4838 domain-containing protein [bacterium]
PSGFNPAKRPDIYEEEGYIIQTKGPRIFLAGNQDGPYFGTTYAVCAFLEQLGCRWYFPGDWGEIVPEQKTVTVPELKVTAKPDFAMRGIWLDGRWGLSQVDRVVYRQWCARVGFSGDNLGGARLYPVPGDGYLGHPLPPREYATTHPEWYAMNKQGQRQVQTNTYSGFAMLCLSNDQMAEQYIANIREVFDGKRQSANVSALGIGISPPDGTPYCYCTNCLAATQNFFYPTYLHERMQSEEVCQFAVRLADTFPDKWVSVSAYALRVMPPQGIKLRPNMSVMYAPISCCVLHSLADPACWRRQEMLRILTQWQRQTPHVWLYDYSPSFLVSQFVPEADIPLMTTNAPIYKKVGLKGFGRQGSNAMMATWLGYYVAAKLMWDVGADVDRIKTEFYRDFFGPEAGPHVRAWWDACEAAVLAARIHPHEDWLVNHIYTAEFARSIRPHVAAARKASMTDAQRQRFHIFELIVENFEAATEMEEADLNLAYGKAAAAAGRMLAARTKLNQISEFLIGKGAQTVTWEGYTAGRQQKYQALAAMTGGTNGTLIVALPLEAKFHRDRFNEGVVAEWYAPGFDDKDWDTKNTFYLWEQQDPPEDAAGHDYDGYGWYRTSVRIPAKFRDKPIHFYGGSAINEAWVWVNGEYAGHKPHGLWWMQANSFDLDVTKLVKPGRNTIAIRVFNDADVGGWSRRGFFWSPKENR